MPRDKGKAKVMEQLKKRKRQHREVKHALVVAAVAKRSERGCSGGPLRIGTCFSSHLMYVFIS